MQPVPRERLKPDADPAEVEEFERLLGERFARDPSLPRTPAEEAQDAAARARIEELSRRIFRCFT